MVALYPGNMLVDNMIGLPLVLLPLLIEPLRTATDIVVIQRQVRAIKRSWLRHKDRD